MGYHAPLPTLTPKGNDMSAPRVLVTGGGRGIGRAIALRFAREGARVVVAARTATEIDKVVAEIERAGGTGMAAQFDVREEQAVAAGMWRVMEFLDDTIDVLVNNAGVFHVAPLEEVDYERWRWMFLANVDGPFFVTKECLEALKASGRGHVININSVAGKRGFAGNVAYCASKYALRGLSDALREELKPAGIRVTSVYPGPTDTTIFEGVKGDWDRSKMNRPEDVAEVVWQAWSSPRDANVDDLDVPAR
jgi:NAD(P)-dependent dehydrogenase (short-subunit alcohol dehydrogenase family)